MTRARSVTTTAFVGAVISATSVLGAEPSPTGFGPGGLAPGDVRSGEAPGLAGGPVEVLLLVIALGVATALATVIVVRAAQWRTGRRDG